MGDAAEYDSPWKEVVRRYIRSLLRLCFPSVEPLIDWSRAPEFLDKELQKIVRDAQSGIRYVDTLVKVWLLDGSEKWILLHIEIQHWPDPAFPERMYFYNVRVYDVYGQPVATLAILADADPNWRPSHYEREAPGTRVRIDFSVCKLLDLVADEAALRASREPAAIVVLANWAVQYAGKDNNRRLALKWDLTRRLYEIRLSREDILELYRLLDWLLKLPKELEEQLLQRVHELEQEKRMPYITSAEQFGIEKGIQQGMEKGLQEGLEKGLQEGLEKGLQEGLEKGLQQGRLLSCRENILALLETRFGEIPPHIAERLEVETDLGRLKSLLKLAGTCASLEAFSSV